MIIRQPYFSNATDFSFEASQKLEGFANELQVK